MACETAISEEDGSLLVMFGFDANQKGDFYKVLPDENGAFTLDSLWNHVNELKNREKFS